MPHSNPKPGRPLTAYNLFFREERRKVKAVFSRLKSADRPSLSRYIGDKWKAATPSERAHYDVLAVKEKTKYAAKLLEWHERRQGEQDQEQDRPERDVIKGEGCIPLEPMTFKDPPTVGSNGSFSSFFDLGLKCRGTGDTFDDPHFEEQDYFKSPLSSVGGSTRPHPVPILCNNDHHNNDNAKQLAPLYEGLLPIDTQNDNDMHHHDIRLVGGKPNAQHVVRGSLEWLAQELGPQGVRMLVNMFADG
eukprot:scaffold8504_cov267-Amphora_coffeaeformis.AAC.2